MKIQIQRNYQGSKIETYRVSEDFIDVIKKYALQSTQRPEWWIWYEDEQYEYELGFPSNPLLIYYDIGGYAPIPLM